MRVWTGLMLLFGLTPLAVRAADWPQWGGRNERNFVSGEPRLPAEFSGGDASPGSPAGRPDGPPAAAKNLKWKVPLGTQTYSTPAVADGRVFICSNDERIKDDRFKKSAGGLVLCLDEKTGDRLWQFRSPRLKTKNRLFNFDDLGLGICSSPLVAGDRLYIVGNRGDVICMDVRGQENGNDGPFKDEGAYMVDTREFADKPGRFDPASAPPPPAPVDVRKDDGDIAWTYDFFTALDVWTQDATDCSILALGDRLFVCTSIGVDRTHKFIPSPDAPNLIVLDRHTGALLATNEAPLGARIFHGDWSSPTLARGKSRDLVVWGGGDGFCYAYDPDFKPGADGAPGELKKVWWFDCNPPHNRLRDGQPLPYNKNREGPSEVIATPVFADGRIYVGVGQDSRHGEGPGCFSCIDPSGAGDVTSSGRVWQSFDVQRSFSSAAVLDGRVYLADYSGFVYCFDAKTGKPHWKHKLSAHVISSPFAADGKVYVCDDKGGVTVFAASKDKRILAGNRLDAPIHATPVAANGTLFIATWKTLYAFEDR